MAMKSHPLYCKWRSMKRRCQKPGHKQYRNYGARGISVCPMWEHFWTFVFDMGMPPSPQHSIDRIDNDGNYELENCRWATSKEQVHNSRCVNMLTHEGETLPVKEWARRISGDPNYNGGGLRKTLRTKGVAHAIFGRTIRNPDGSLKKR